MSTARDDAFEAKKAAMEAYMRTHPKFTMKEVEGLCAASTTRCRTWLRRLKRNGTVRRLGTENGTAIFTTLTIPEAMDKAKAYRQTPEGAIWTAIRTFCQFTLEDIANGLACTGDDVPDDLIRRYCAALLSAGYFRVLRKESHSRGVTARYMLIKNTGPLPPKVKRKQVVIDANDDCVVHVSGERL